MVVASQRLHVRLGVSRTALELVALVVGFALGGTVGIGTLAFALGIGPAVELSFRLLARTPLAAPAVASPRDGGKGLIARAARRRGSAS